MSKENITARYRPKFFNEIAGQENIKGILSKAAAESSLAPAYLFSGTRGVGKTSTARIFVKALNCEKAPCGEPCNECHFCRQITKGACPDVLEIDGASNNGVEHVRRLTEEIGYAPLECRYKIIIIDEAHMLSKAAFNALLKTLEEPPAHAIFILATTEPEKFPPTIISRCQHYVFKALRGEELYSHLAGILEKEGIEFEKEALEILVQRGNGSARDCMSLLAQMLVLGKKTLLEQDVRSVLGLAHKNIQYAILRAIAAENLEELHRLGSELLSQGLDIGFFLRELIQNWRNLFLFLQLKEKAESLLEISENELESLRQIAPLYSPSRLHASWQLTLEGQQRVLRSPDPAMALEILLVNLACLSHLLPLCETEIEKKKPQQQIINEVNKTGEIKQTKREEPQKTKQEICKSEKETQAADLQDFQFPQNQNHKPTPPQNPQTQEDTQKNIPEINEGSEQNFTKPSMTEEEMPPLPDFPEELLLEEPHFSETAENFPKAPMQEDLPPKPQITDDLPPSPTGLDWAGFCKYAQEKPQKISMLQSVKPRQNNNRLELYCEHQIVFERLTSELKTLQKYVSEFFGTNFQLDLKPPVQKKLSYKQLQEQALEQEIVQNVIKNFQARLVSVRPLDLAKENQ